MTKKEALERCIELHKKYYIEATEKQYELYQAAIDELNAKLDKVKKEECELDSWQPQG